MDKPTDIGIFHRISSGKVLMFQKKWTNILNRRVNGVMFGHFQNDHIF